MVPLNEYSKSENDTGCVWGCVTVLGVIILVAFGLFVVPNVTKKQNAKQSPKHEVRERIDTTYRIADTMRVYKTR